MYTGELGSPWSWNINVTKLSSFDPPATKHYSQDVKPASRVDGLPLYELNNVEWSNLHFPLIVITPLNALASPQNLP